MKKHLVIVTFAVAFVLCSVMGASAQNYSDMKFDISTVVDEQMNLGEFSQFCVSYFNLYGISPADNAFDDLQDDNAYKDSILRLVGGGFLRGNGDGTVGCDELVSKDRAYTILSRIIAYCGGGAIDEEIYLAPNATAQMCDPSFWLLNQNDCNTVLMTQDEIQNLNRQILDTKGTCTIDLSAINTDFDGRHLADKLANFSTPTELYIDGEKVGEDFFTKIRTNIKNAKLNEQMNVKYGFAVNRTTMKAYPYEEMLSDSPTDPEWDQCVNTAIYLNEPLVAYLQTADEKFWYVACDCCTGWVPTRDIAFCTDKDQWESLRSPERFLVVTGEKLYLEASMDADLSQKVMTMGTVVALSDDEPGAVAGRLPWYNYMINLPCRNDDGSLYFKKALVSANRDVSVGYLPYTTQNVVRQAFKLLGNRYGWGGMLMANDCSAMIQDIYRCFGFELARNDTWQAQMPVKVIEIANMTDQEKCEVLKTIKPGAVLRFPGHIMMYLGEKDGLYYTINNVSSLVNPQNVEQGIIRPRSVIINDLSTKRASGKTWLECLSQIIIIEP